ncbi:MAG: ABC transporter ATP-binding protein [Candidatus Heimdallarchaeota archaeon]|nr:ABC transporter ATP-binding protein [Candidatus Heimdallarchaeota archaeon]
MQHIITVNDLQKIYPNGVEAISGIDLTIQKGEVFGLLGPNGAGKSTLMNILVGLLEASNGTISMDQDSKMGYVPQDLVFYENLTVEENLVLFARCEGMINYKDRVQELMTVLELKELKKRRAGKMSGGQKRRLNIAIGMINQPDILILDEPSAGMDPQSRNILWKLINKLSEDMTIILTTHLMEVADALADRVAIIDQGRVVAIGTPEELKQGNGAETTLEITLKHDTTAMIMVGGKEIEVVKGKITMEGQSEEILPDVLTALKENFGAQCVAGLQLKQKTLEDVFIQLTGSQLREESP